MRRGEKEPSGSFFCFCSLGFTMMELVTVLIIASVLAVVALPRLWGSTFDEAKLYDDTLAALRYAQRAAIAMQRTVCATAATTTQLTLTYASSYGSATCNTDLVAPGGSTATYQVSASGSASYSATWNGTFDRTGQPGAGQTIALSGGRTITIEAVTGYVH